MMTTWADDTGYNRIFSEQPVRQMGEAGRARVLDMFTWDKNRQAVLGDLRRDEQGRGKMHGRSSALGT